MTPRPGIEPGPQVFISVHLRRRTLWQLVLWHQGLQGLQGEKSTLGLRFVDFILIFPCLPDMAWAATNMAELAQLLGSTAEHSK